MKVVMLPGMDGTGRLLRPLAEALTAHGYRSRIISYPTDRARSYEWLIERTVAPALPHRDDFVLLAESYAGPMALSLAQKQTPRLRGLVLAVTFADPPDSALLALTRLLPMESILSLPVPCWMAHKVMLGKTEPRREKDVFCQVVRGMRPEVIAGRLEKVRRFELEAKKITLPALYIRALNDPLLPSKAIEGVRRLIPDLRIHELPGPHLVLYAKPERCAEIAANFIKTIH